MRKCKKCCGPDQSLNAKFPTSEQADQFSLGVHSIAKDRGASLFGQGRF